MNLVYAEIVRVGAALNRISTALIGGVRAGDTVLVRGGEAIGKVENTGKDSDVSGNSR
jgi:hypothetical protein